MAHKLLVRKHCGGLSLNYGKSRRIARKKGDSKMKPDMAARRECQFPTGRLILAGALLLALLCTSGSLFPRPGQPDEKALIEKTIRASIGWALTKDRPMLESALANDERLFIFHPDSKSTVAGWTRFAKQFDFWMDPKFRATSYEVRDLRIDLSRSGDVAWWSAILDDLAEWDGRPIGWKDTRWTGVLEKRDGRWVIVLMHFSFASDRTPPAFPALSGPYLGQKPPGAKAEVFAPGLVSTGMTERAIAVSPDGREIYFELALGQVVTIMVTRLENDRWTEPAVAPFAADLGYFHFEPCLSADGKRMLFLSNRPRKGQQPKPGWGHQNIWASDRGADGRWGEPYDLGGPVNSDEAAFYPSLTRDGSLYFTRSKLDGGNPRIVRSRITGGKYAEPEPLPKEVNGRGKPYNAFIAPDESYLIACVEDRDDSLTPGLSNYYIFFRGKDDLWTEGVNLGPKVNFPGAGASAPYVTSDGRYFFFGSNRRKEIAAHAGKPVTLSTLKDRFTGPQNGGTDIYWIEASFLEKFRRGPRP